MQRTLQRGLKVPEAMAGAAEGGAVDSRPGVFHEDDMLFVGPRPGSAREKDKQGEQAHPEQEEQWSEGTSSPEQ